MPRACRAGSARSRASRARSSSAPRRSRTMPFILARRPPFGAWGGLPLESKRRARFAGILIAVWLLASLVISAPPSDGEERLVSKQDADRIFALNRSQWEAE